MYLTLIRLLPYYVFDTNVKRLILYYVFDKFVIRLIGTINVFDTNVI